MPNSRNSAGSARGRRCGWRYVTEGRDGVAMTVWHVSGCLPAALMSPERQTPTSDATADAPALAVLAAALGTLKGELAIAHAATEQARAQAQEAAQALDELRRA